MTVEKLIEELKKVDPTLLVKVNSNDGWGTMDEIELVEVTAKREKEPFLLLIPS